MSVREASEGRPGEVRGESGRRPNRPKRLRFSSFEPESFIFAVPVQQNGCETSPGSVRGAPETRKGLDSGVEHAVFACMCGHRPLDTRGV